MSELPEIPDRDTLAGHLGQMLVARGAGLPRTGEPWRLVQVTEPAETGTLNEEPIMAFDVLFLAPAERDDGTYVFTDEGNQLVGAMYCTGWVSPTGATCMRSNFSSVGRGEAPADTEGRPSEEETGQN